MRHEPSSRGDKHAAQMAATATARARCFPGHEGLHTPAHRASGQLHRAGADPQFIDGQGGEAGGGLDRCAELQ